MPEQWLSYRQLAQLWKTTPEAARARTRRGNWQRRSNNAGVAEVLVDTDAPVPESRQKALDGQTRSATPLHTPDAETPPMVTVKALEALEAHVATLKEQLAKAEALAAERNREATVERERRNWEVDLERERVADLTSQILKLSLELLEVRKADVRPRSWWQRLTG